MMHWTRTRLTQWYDWGNMGDVRLLIGERSDGGVFYLMDAAQNETPESVLRATFDWYLTRPLVESSIGQFDKEPLQFAGEST